jgi:hypothetical protein
MAIDSKSLFKYASMVPISGKVEYWGHFICTMFGYTQQRHRVYHGAVAGAQHVLGP